MNRRFITGRQILQSKMGPNSVALCTVGSHDILLEVRDHLGDRADGGAVQLIIEGQMGFIELGDKACNDLYEFLHKALKKED